MNIAVWVVQVLLALAFAGSGFMKITTPIDALHAQMAWSRDFPDLAIRLIGVLEVLGAIGLVLPSATRIMPKLTVAAAVGLVLTMVGAAITHIRIGELGFIGVNALLGGLAAFVAWARLKKVPIAPR